MLVIHSTAVVTAHKTVMKRDNMYAGRSAIVLLPNIIRTGLVSKVKQEDVKVFETLRRTSISYLR